MNNTAIHITLPEPLLELAKARAEDEKFDSISEYVRSLIREDLRRMEEQKMEQIKAANMTIKKREDSR